MADWVGDVNYYVSRDHSQFATIGHTLKSLLTRLCDGNDLLHFIKISSVDAINCLLSDDVVFCLQSPSLGQFCETHMLVVVLVRVTIVQKSTQTAVENMLSESWQVNY